MQKSELKAIIAAGGGTSINASKYDLEELATILNTTKALVVVEIPASMTYHEVLRLAKEGSGHVFFTGDRMRETD